MALVSIIVPTYKRPDLLRRAIDSGLKQTYSDFEIVVVDDSPEEEGRSVCLSYRDSRVKYWRNCRSKGACGARNTGIDVALGRFCTFLDDDDAFLPNRIAYLVEAYKRSLSFVATNILVVNGENGKYLFTGGRSIEMNDLLWCNCVGNQIFAEKYKLLDIEGYDEDLTAFQDRDLLIRLVARWGAGWRLSACTYVVYMKNDIERISNSPMKRAGMVDCYEKHKHLMTFGQRRVFLLNIESDAGSNLHFAKLLACVNPFVLAYYLRRLFRLI